MIALALALEACSASSEPASAPSQVVVRPTVEAGAPVLLRDQDGMALFEQQWQFADQRGRSWLVRLPREAGLDVVPSSTVESLDNLLAGQIAPYAAINGGFYDNGPMGLVVSEGSISSPLSVTGGSGVLLGGDRPMAVVHRDHWVEGPSEAVQSIDRLVDAGQPLVRFRENAPRATRSAVVLGSDYMWLVLATEERTLLETPDGWQLVGTSGLGLPLWAFAGYVVAALHAEEVLNLDGAVSSALRVVYRDDAFKIAGERGTINAVVVRPAQPQ